MGQKIHPLGLRLGITQKHRSKWFATKKNYPRLMLEDRFFRNYLLKTYPKAKIVDIHVLRDPTLEKKETDEKFEKTTVVIYTPIPREMVGKKEPKKKLEELRVKLLDICTKERKKQNAPTLLLNLKLLPVRRPYGEASMIADDLIEQLEKRTSFRKALKKTLFRMKRGEVFEKVLQGTRIQISGRLNGAEIARIEWTRKGRVPLHTLRADVGYVSKTAKTIYGILGIKVWTFTKEKF